MRPSQLAAAGTILAAIMLTGCGSTTGALTADGSTTGLTGTCVMGYEDMYINGVQVNSDNAGAQPPVFAAGPPPAGDQNGPVTAYELTLTAGTSPVNVSGYQVVFWGSSGTEAGSETMTVTVQLLEPGQSLAWIGGIGDGNTDVNIPDEEDPAIPQDAATCTYAAAS